MLKILSYTFMQRALIVGILTALSAGILGVSLTLRRYSMIGDGLSHIGFGAIALGLALGANPMAFSLPVVVLAAIFLLKLSDNSPLNGDSAIALISSSALAVGVIASTLARGVNVDISSYMFGSILAMTKADVYLSSALSVIVIIMLVILYNRIFSITFDEEFARATGIAVEKISTVLSILTAITISIGMRMVGVLLISSLIIFPALTAQRIFKTFKPVVISSAVISVVNMILGLTVSAWLKLPTGATIVCCSLFNYILAFLIEIIRKK